MHAARTQPSTTEQAQKTAPPMERPLTQKQQALGLALMAATLEGRDDEVRALLEKQAPIVPDSMGCTPLAVAAKRGHAGCVRLLLPVSDPAAVSVAGFTPFAEAVRSGSFACAELLRSVSDVDALIGGSQMPLLFLAAAKNRVDMIAYLLPHANTLFVSPAGDTALIVAAAAGCLDAVRLLIPFSDVLAKDEEEGATALMWAAESGNEEMASLLLSVSDPSATNKNRRTAFKLAIEAEKWGVADILADDQHWPMAVLFMRRKGKALFPRTFARHEALALSRITGQATRPQALDSTAERHPASPRKARSL